MSNLQKRQELPEIVRRYASGESLADIAKDYNKSRHTIYLWMLSGMGDKEHEHLVTQSLVNRIADADQELDSAESMLNIARAREQARFARMDFERRRPNLYGPKQEMRHTGSAPSLQITVSVAPQQNDASSGNVINNATQLVEDKR